jgi:ribosomal protein S12 methylthiotransferase accessory factor
MTYVSGARDDVTPDEFTSEAVARKCRIARTLIRESSPQRNFDVAPRYSSNDFADDLEWLIGQLQQIGCQQVLRCDLTRQDIGLAVVRVVIPGLEGPHDDEGYEPGVRARRAVETHV